MKKLAVCFLLSLLVFSGISFGQAMSTPIRIYNSPLNASKWTQVAFGPFGDVHVVWEEDYSTTKGSDIFYMHYDGVTWEGPVNLKNSPSIPAERPYVCTSQNESVFVVWNEDGRVWVCEYDPETEAWKSPEKVSTRDYGSDEPACAADPDGNIYIIWYDYGAGNTYSRAKIDGVWEPIKRLNGPFRATQVGMASGSDGMVWAIWREKQDDGEYKLNYSRRKKDTAWRVLKDVNWGGASQTHPHMAVGPDNVPVVTYADIDEHEAIEVFICTIDEKTNPRQRVMPDFMHYSRVAVDSLGNIHLAWQIGPGDSGNGIKYTNNMNQPEGLWQDPIVLPYSYGEPKLPGIAADSLGNVAVVFSSAVGEGDKDPWFCSLYPVEYTPPVPPPPPPVPDPPVNLRVNMAVRGLKGTPALQYTLNWEKNPANIEKNVVRYNFYRKEDSGEFELLMSLNPDVFSAVFSFNGSFKRYHFGISTVYEFVNDEVYADGVTESEIAVFGFQQ